LIEDAKTQGDPIFILGKSFRPETDITDGSLPILLKNILE
jgi:hypothetical protein